MTLDWSQLHLFLLDFSYWFSQFFWNFQLVIQEFLGNFPFFYFLEFSACYSGIFREFSDCLGEFSGDSGIFFFFNCLEFSGCYSEMLVFFFSGIFLPKHFLFFFCLFFFSGCYSGILRNFHLVFRVILGLPLEIFLRLFFRLFRIFVSFSWFLSLPFFVAWQSHTRFLVCMPYTSRMIQKIHCVHDKNGGMS